MKNQTLYISDLDGTLLNRNSTVSPHSIEKINYLLQKGMLFTIATARTPATVVPLLEQLQIDIPAVLMNGAVLYDIRRKLYIRTNGFTDNSALRYIDLLEKRGLIPFVYRIDNNKLKVFHKPLAYDIQREFKRQRENTPYKEFIPTINYSDELLDNPPLFFCYRDIVDPEYGYLEIYPKGVSKAATAQQIIDKLTPWEVVAFGDNLNDMPLFKIADRRYAPENAVDEVKQQATAIIADNDHDGVALFLEKDFL